MSRLKFEALRNLITFGLPHLFVHHSRHVPFLSARILIDPGSILLSSGNHVFVVHEGNDNHTGVRIVVLTHAA